MSIIFAHNLSLLRYIELHNIYRERANQDIETVLRHVHQLVEALNIPRSVRCIIEVYHKRIIVKKSTYLTYRKEIQKYRRLNS